jgi:hypothetical protein
MHAGMPADDEQRQGFPLGSLWPDLGCDLKGIDMRTSETRGRRVKGEEERIGKKDKERALHASTALWRCSASLSHTEEGSQKHIAVVHHQKRPAHARLCCHYLRWRGVQNDITR